MAIFISPLIKAHAYFAIIEGYVFIHFLYVLKQKERDENVKINCSSHKRQ